MNQPTREEFEQLKEEVRELKKQQTEPIHVTVERRQTEVERTQELHTAMLQELCGTIDGHTQMLMTLQHNVQSIKTSVSNLGSDMQKRFDSIAEVQKLILARLPEKGE